jgi:hypothetical protein
LQVYTFYFRLNRYLLGAIAKQFVKVFPSVEKSDIYTKLGPRGRTCGQLFSSYRKFFRLSKRAGNYVLNTQVTETVDAAEDKADDVADAGEEVVDEVDADEEVVGHAAVVEEVDDKADFDETDVIVGEVIDEDIANQVDVDENIADQADVDEAALNATAGDESDVDMAACDDSDNDEADFDGGKTQINDNQRDLTVDQNFVFDIAKKILILARHRKTEALEVYMPLLKGSKIENEALPGYNKEHMIAVALLVLPHLLPSRLFKKIRGGTRENKKAVFIPISKFETQQVFLAHYKVHNFQVC